MYANWGLDESPGIKPMIFCGDGQHLAYGAKVEDSWLIVLDRRRGKPFKSVGGPVLTHDGQHLAYAAKVEDGWCIVRDGVEGKTYEEGRPAGLQRRRCAPRPRCPGGRTGANRG